MISRYEALSFATLVVALCALRRLRVAVLTLRANHKPSLLLPLLSRLTGSLNSSPSHKHALLAAVPREVRVRARPSPSPSPLPSPSPSPSPQS